MKAVRIIADILIGIIMFVLILSLSIVITTKNFIEKDLLLGLVKVSISETLNKEANNIVDNKDEILNEIFSDETTKDVVQIFFDNFKEYQDNKKGFTVSDSDVEIITTFALKYKDKIRDLSSDKEEITDEKIKEILSKDNINQLSNKVYEEINSGIGEETDEAFKIYENVTSSSSIIIVISVIIVLIIILGLINWSVYKWMIVPGVCLIISGVIVLLMYVMCLFLNEIISASGWLNETIGSLDFSIYLIVGGIELIIGVILVIVYNSIKNKPFNDQINNLGVGE